MTSESFKVGAHTYRAGRLPVLDQNHVARRYGSVLIFLGTLQRDQPREPSEYARAMVATSGNLSNEDVDFAIGACLSVVQRQQAGGAAWAPVRAPSGQLMFDDIELVELMEIIWHVLRENKLIDFFFVAPSGSPVPAEGAQK